jgi:hypothetical protein
MQEFFFLTLQRPAHSAPMGNLKFFAPISLFFHLYVLGVFLVWMRFAEQARIFPTWGKSQD